MRVARGQERLLGDTCKEGPVCVVILQGFLQEVYQDTDRDNRLGQQLIWLMYSLSILTSGISARDLRIKV